VTEIKKAKEKIYNPSDGNNDCLFFRGKNKHAHAKQDNSKDCIKDALHGYGIRRNDADKRSENT
jgi:hypothetical protein